MMKRSRSAAVMVLATAIAVLATGTARAQGVGYLFIQGVTNGDLSAQSVGPALADPAHVDEALVMSFSHEVRLVGDPFPGGGGSATSPDHGELTIVKPVSASTPILYGLLHVGTHIDEVQLRLYRDHSGVPTQYFRVILRDAVIVGITPRLAGDGVTSADAPSHLESVVLAYAEIEWQHLGSGTNFSWDLLTNTQPKVSP